MGRISDFERLVPAIYEAASAPEGWGDVLASLCEAIDVDTVLFALLPQDRMWTGDLWGGNIDPDSVTNVMKPELVDRSIGFLSMITAPLLHTFDFRMQGLAALEADPGAQHLLMPQGLTQGRFTSLLREHGTLGGTAFLNEASRGPLDPEKVAEIETMLPTLAHAARISLRQRRLQDEMGMLRAALGQLVTGVVILTEGLTIRHANAEAERILEAADGISQRLGQLRLADAATSTALRRDIAALSGQDVGKPPFCVFVRRPSGAPPYTMVVAPAGAMTSAGGAVAATLFITDPVGPTTLPMPAILADAFGLSATEAEVMRLAAMGRGTGFVAASLGVSLNTARTHLKAIYAKTGVNQQAALSRLVATSFPPVSGLGEP